MALIGYQAEISRIEQKMAEIRGQLGSRVKPVVAQKETPKRILSAAARARIATAQKKRWAAFHKGKKAAVVPEVAKAKRRISAAGMKRIIAATKKRWAAKRAAAENPEPTATKKAAAKKAVARVKTARMAKKPSAPTTTAVPQVPAQ
jgi:hypothetical protein